MAARGPAPASAWVRAREKIERDLLAQYLIDRDCGRMVKLEDGSRPVPSAGLTYDELADAARTRATEVCRRSIAKYESPEALLRRRQKADEAA